MTDGKTTATTSASIQPSNPHFGELSIGGSALLARRKVNAHIDGLTTDFADDAIAAHRPSFGVNLDTSYIYAPTDSAHGFAMTLGGGYANGPLDTVSWSALPQWRVHSEKVSLDLGVGVTGMHYGEDNNFAERFALNVLARASVRLRIVDHFGVYGQLDVLLPVTGEQHSTADIGGSAGITIFLGAQPQSSNKTVKNTLTIDSLPFSPKTIADKLAIAQHALNTVHAAGSGRWMQKQEYMLYRISNIIDIHFDEDSKTSNTIGTYPAIVSLMAISPWLLDWVDGKEERTYGKDRASFEDLKPIAHYQQLIEHMTSFVEESDQGGATAEQQATAKQLRHSGAHLQQEFTTQFTALLEKVTINITNQLTKMKTDAFESIASNNKEWIKNNKHQLHVYRSALIALTAFTKRIAPHADSATGERLKAMEDRFECLVNGTEARCESEQDKEIRIPGLMDLLTIDSDDSDS